MNTDIDGSTSTLFYTIIECHTAHMQCQGSSFPEVSCAIYYAPKLDHANISSNIKTENALPDTFR